MRVAFDITKHVFFEECLYKKPYVFKGAIQGGSIGWQDVMKCMSGPMRPIEASS